MDTKMTYSSTSSRVMGVLGVVVATGAAGFALAAEDGPSYAGVALCVFLGTACWASMLRPAVTVDATSLVMRNLVTTVTVPLAAIESVDVRLVLIVRAAARSITSSALGRSRRDIHRRGQAARSAPGLGGIGVMPAMQSMAEDPAVNLSSYEALAESQIRARVELARSDAGIENFSLEQAALAEQVTTTWAVPEIALLAVSAVAFVVLLIV